MVTNYTQQAGMPAVATDNVAEFVDQAQAAATAAGASQTSASASASSASASASAASAAAATLVVDAATVTAAGALMDSELTSIADIKALNQSVVSGSTPTLGIANMTVDATGLVVSNSTNLQSFASGVDSALLKARGTGVTSTYVSTVAVGGTTFAQPAVKGEISSDQGYFEIDYAGATGITVANLTTISAYVYIDNAGALQQQSTIPTRQDFSRKMFTMRIGINTVTGTIIGFEYFNNPIGHYANSIRDLYTFLIAQGVPFKRDQTVTGRAGDLGFDVSAGTLMEFGGTGDIHNANIKSFDAVTNASYNLLSKTALISSETNLVKFWDNAGTITALGSTTVVGHRLYRFSNGNFAIQYGQGNYANMALAKSGVLIENYEKNPNLLNATFFGWWLIQETATNTGGTTLTNFLEYTIGVQGGSSSGLSGCLLKGNNLSDLLDAPTARSNLGLGSVATTAASAYATAAQGVKADSAAQPNTSPTFSVVNADSYTETVFALTGTTPSIDPVNGGLQTWTLPGASTPTVSIADGESVTVMIDDGSTATITWPTIYWLNTAGVAPALAATGYTVIVLWAVSTTLYGALVGDGT